MARAVGLDIGRHAVRAVWAERAGAGLVVTRVESMLLPQEGADSSAVIGPWLEKIGLARQGCVIGLPGEQCMFQPLQLAPGDPRELAQAASMEVLQFNEMSSEPMEHDYVPIRLNPGEKRLLLAMSRPTVLSQWVQRATGFGVRPTDLVPVPVALHNLHAALQAPGPEAVLYVDIGRASTNLAVGHAGGLLFARAFSSGGQLFTDALARAGRMPSARAEKLKIDQGRVAEGVPVAEGGLLAAADQWLAEVQSCLQVYQSLYPGRFARIARVMLTGGGARLPGLAGHVERKLGLTVSIPESLPAARGVEVSADFAVAAGLAASGLDGAAATLSLLPVTLKDELTFRRQKPVWIAAAVCAGLILTVSLVGGFRDQRRKEAHLNAQRQSLQRRQALVAEIEQIRLDNDYLRSLAQPLQGLLETAPMTRDLITLLANCMDTDDWLTLVCDAQSYFSPRAFLPPAPEDRRRARHNAPARNLPGAPTNGFDRIIVEGFTRTANFSTVKDLILKLEASDIVETADLLFDDKLVSRFSTTNAPRDPDARRFVLDLKAARP